MLRQLIFILLLIVGLVPNVYGLTIEYNGVDHQVIDTIIKRATLTSSTFDKGAYDVATTKIESCKEDSTSYYNLSCKSKMYIPVSFFKNPSQDILNERSQRTIKSDKSLFPYYFILEIGMGLSQILISLDGELIIVSSNATLNIDSGLYNMRYIPNRGKTVYISTVNNYGYLHIAGMSYKPEYHLHKFNVSNRDKEKVLNFFK